MIKALDKEAERLKVSREAIIKVWLDQKIKENTKLKL
jgi:hypothetical protein